MKTKIFMATLLCCLSAPGFCRTRLKASPPPNDSPATAYRIRFGRGVTSRQVKGWRTDKLLSPYYVFHAQSGQRLTIRVQSLSAPGVMEPIIYVAPPVGEPTEDKRSLFESDVAKSGDYIVRVGCNHMASDRLTGPFVLKIWLRPKPRLAHPVHASK